MGGSQKPYSSESAFLEARRRVQALTEKSSASEAQLLLTELCELCLSEDFSLAMLENGLLDELALIFREEPTYSVQLLVTTAICLCLKCRRGTIYYNRNVSHTTQFLTDMLRSTRPVVGKLSRHCGSSCASKENIIPLAFTAFAWPHLLVPQGPSSNSFEVPIGYPNLGRRIFESAKQHFAVDGGIPPLPKASDFDYEFDESVELREEDGSELTIANIAIDGLYMLIDSREPLRSLFKKRPQFVSRVKRALLNDTTNYKLFPLLLLSAFRQGQTGKDLDKLVDTLWGTFYLHTTNRDQCVLSAKHALNALVLIANCGLTKVLQSKAQGLLLQKFLLDTISSTKASVVAPAWGLAVLLGDNILESQFLGMTVAKMIEMFRSKIYTPPLAFASCAVAMSFLQGYIEMPARFLQHIIGCLMYFQKENSRFRMEQVIQSLDERLPPKLKMLSPYTIPPSKKPIEKAKPPKKRAKKVSSPNILVGPSPLFFWGLSSQFYLAMISDICQTDASPWLVIPNTDTKMEDLVEEQARMFTENKSELPHISAAPATPAVADKLSSRPSPPPVQAPPEPKTPTVYASDTTIDWTPQSNQKREFKGFKESRQPQSVPAPLQLNAQPSVVLESASKLVPTFTAMYGPSENWKPSLTPLMATNFPSSASLMPPADIPQPNVPASTVLLFSLTPTTHQKFDPALACDSRDFEPCSALLKATFSNAELLIPPTANRPE